MRRPGRYFLQIPGPTSVPDRVMRAIDMPVLDHRGPDFHEMSSRVLEKIKTIFKTSDPVFIFPSSGSGAWEAALVNTLSPGDQVLMFETGQFSALWKATAEGLGLVPVVIESDWRTGVDENAIADALRADTERAIKAVCIVHNETSSGCTSSIPAVRHVMDTLDHPALLMVDTISALGSIDYRHSEWRVDVAVGGSQKGLMLPPGLAFNAVSQKALEAAKTARLPKAYFSWSAMSAFNATGFFPYTPATTLLYGLDVAIDMLHEEGLDNVFARHARHGEATRTAVAAWGLDLICRTPEHYSPSLTAVMMPEGASADALRALVLDRFNMAIGAGLGRFADKAFRIGHLGDFNDLSLVGALGGLEMGLKLCGVKLAASGIAPAMAVLAPAETAVMRQAAE